MPAGTVTKTLQVVGGQIKGLFFSANPSDVTVPLVPATQLVDINQNDALGEVQANPSSANTILGRLKAINDSLQQMFTDSSPALMVGITTRKTASFNRPADVNAYTAGDLVAQNTTGASVTPMQFTVAGVNGGSGMVRKANIRKSGVSITNATFRLHLFTAAPSIAAGANQGDNAVFASVVTGLASYIGSIDITVDRALVDGAVGGGAAHAGSEINYVCSGTDTKLYGLLEVTAAYTPANAETFNVDLEFLPNTVTP